MTKRGKSRLEGNNPRKQVYVDGILKKAVNELLKQDGVKKVVLGSYHPCKHRYPSGSLKHREDIRTGIRVNGYYGRGIQDIIVVISPIEKREDIKNYIKQEYSL